MFNVGDIVELYNGEEDKVYTGMISSSTMISVWDDENEDYYKVVWFDEKSSLTNEHYSNLQKVS